MGTWSLLQGNSEKKAEALSQQVRLWCQSKPRPGLHFQGETFSLSLSLFLFSLLSHVYPVGHCCHGNIAVRLYRMWLELTKRRALFVHLEKERSWNGWNPSLSGWMETLVHFEAMKHTITHEPQQRNESSSSEKCISDLLKLATLHFMCGLKRKRNRHVWAEMLLLSVLQRLKRAERLCRWPHWFKAAGLLYLKRHPTMRSECTESFYTLGRTRKVEHQRYQHFKSKCNQ